MGRKVRLGGLAVAVVGVAFATTVAQAQITADLFGPGGASSVSLNPGDSTTIDMVLSSPDPAANNFDAFIVDFLFSAGGLQLDGYRLGSPFVAGGPFDFSSPTASGNPSVPLGSIIPMGNVNFQSFDFASSSPGSGTIVSVDVTLPMGATLTGPIVITPDVAGGQLGFQSLGVARTAISGASFTIVPEPATLALLGTGGLLMVLRRRRRKQ